MPVPSRSLMRAAASQAATAAGVIRVAIETADRNDMASARHFLEDALNTVSVWLEETA